MVGHSISNLNLICHLTFVWDFYNKQALYCGQHLSNDISLEHILFMQSDSMLMDEYVYPSISGLLTEGNLPLALCGTPEMTAFQRIWAPYYIHLNQVQVQGGCLPSSYQAKSKQYQGPNGPTASIFHGIKITKSGAMVCILNLDKVSLKKLFPTMNI